MAIENQKRHAIVLEEKSKFDLLLDVKWSA